MQKPFLKWAGGKTRLAEKIADCIPPGSRFVEPFMGSGAVFLNVTYDSYLLADSNADLINLYQILIEEKKKFIEKCREYFKPENNQEDIFYKMRDKFNKSRDVVERSAIFVYLNRHCFNGICRYNSSGEFNIPFGSYATVHFPYHEMVQFIELARNATFVHLDFQDTFKLLQKGDVVYCDPPYLPISQTSNFTSYDADGFSIQEQEKLAELAAKAPCPVLISNHDTEEARRIYHDAQHIESLKVGRFVGGERKPVQEVLVMYNASPSHNSVTIWDI